MISEDKNSYKVLINAKLKAFKGYWFTGNTFSNLGPEINLDNLLVCFFSY